MDLYLKITDNERVFIGSVDHDSIDDVSLSLCVNDRGSELDDFMKLMGKQPILSIPKNYQVMCDAIGAYEKSAILAIPRNKLQIHLQNCLRNIQDVLCDKENADYLVTYLTIKRCLQGLNRASVDHQKLAKLIGGSEHDTVISSLRSFLPEPDQKCKLTTYSMVNSITGRLTVTGGPQILTAPSAVRSCLKSTYKKGKVLQIDIISAEPKFALQIRGGDLPTDVYSHISKNILGNEVQRHHAKLITLCSLYGQSAKNLERKLPEGVSARGVIRETLKYFDYDYLKSRLKSEMSQGNFRNAVGRPIKIENNNEHLLISYYLQSSVAEGSILMFSNFIEKFSNHCKPIFVIHDALLVDCEEKFADILLEKSKIKLSLGDWKFDADVKVVGDI